ncbi:MAG: diguanylate cyclase [Spirochaetes bacterium]|nr:diguanylate cyclase [Spirochaetota bacterium]
MFDLERILADGVLSKRLFDAGYFIGDLANDTGETSKPLRKLGFTDEEMRSGAYQARIHPDDHPTYLALWQRVNEGWENELYVEYRVRDNSGAYHWIETHAVVIERAPDGSIGVVIGTDRNIDSRKQAEHFLHEQYREARAKYELAESLRRTGTVVSADLELSSSLSLGIDTLAGIIAFDQCEIYLAEPDGCRILASRPDSELPSRPEAGPLCEELRAGAYPVLRDDIGAGESFRSWMGIPLRSNGAFLGAVFLWHSTPGFFHGADLYPVTAIAEMLAVAIHNNQYFRRTVSELETDRLTGFLTRTGFERDVDRLWQTAGERYSINTIAMMDIDLFKQVNDRYGHLAGDSVISAFAEAMRANFRHDDVLARYGGEEFVVVLPDTNCEVAARIMNRVRTACAARRIEGISESITVSIGVAVSETPQNVRHVIGRADEALYRAKRGGRNRVEITVLS